MNCKVELWVAGKVFYDFVRANSYDEAVRVAQNRNPNARILRVNAIV